MARPQILLMPDATELEWPIASLLEEWAEVATYDAPGIGDEPPAEGRDSIAVLARGAPERPREGWRRCVVPGDEPTVERGIAELERRDFERCIVVGDEFGAPAAIGLAAASPERVAGLALGHACRSLRRTAEPALINAEVFSGFSRLAQVDYRTFARTLTQVTQGAYDEEMADRYIERVPQETATAKLTLTDRNMDDLEFGAVLAELEIPLFLAEHKGCLLWTRESYQDVVGAFPDAERGSFEQKPSASPEFASALHGFATRVAEVSGEPARRPG